MSRILRERKRLILKEGVLYRRVQDPRSLEVVHQLVLPEAWRAKVWHKCHERAGHFGVEKMLRLIRSRFFWAGLAKDVQTWCSSCVRCTFHKAPSTQESAALVPIQTSFPLELLEIDFLKLPPATDGSQYVLVMIDHFTKYAWAVPTRDQTAATTAKALWSHVTRFFGSPKRLHADQGPNFESTVMKELCKLYGTEKTHTTPYHPQGNGGCERFNRTLIHLLGTLENDQKPRWPEYVQELVFMYNNTVHNSTLQTPSYLLFGWHPRLPVDLFLGTSPARHMEPQTDWVRSHHQRLRYAHQKAIEQAEKARAHQKRVHDRRPQSTPLLSGERVLLKQRGERDWGKLTDYWEDEVYVIVRQPNIELPVYVVKPESGEGPEKVLHRNLLCPCPVSFGQRKDVLCSGPTMVAGGGSIVGHGVFPRCGEDGFRNGYCSQPQGIQHLCRWPRVYRAAPRPANIEGGGPAS